jgi:hypothetical protein
MEAPLSGAVADSAPEFLQGYLSEDEYARQRGVSLRTCQRDRALRQSPPYVIIGRQVYYRLEAVREWLIKRERVEERQSQSFARRVTR